MYACGNFSSKFSGGPKRRETIESFKKSVDDNVFSEGVKSDDIQADTKETLDENRVTMFIVNRATRPKRGQATRSRVVRRTQFPMECPSPPEVITPPPTEKPRARDARRPLRKYEPRKKEGSLIDSRKGEPSSTPDQSAPKTPSKSPEGAQAQAASQDKGKEDKPHYPESEAGAFKNLNGAEELLISADIIPVSASIVTKLDKIIQI